MKKLLTTSFVAVFSLLTVVACDQAQTTSDAGTNAGVDGGTFNPVTALIGKWHNETRETVGPSLWDTFGVRANDVVFTDAGTYTVHTTTSSGSAQDVAGTWQATKSNVGNIVGIALQQTAPQYNFSGIYEVDPARAFPLKYEVLIVAAQNVSPTAATGFGSSSTNGNKYDGGLVQQYTAVP